jgi:hypothetical protein
MDYFNKTDKISESSKGLFNRKLQQWVSWINKDIIYLVKNSKESLKALKNANISHSESNHHLYLSAVVTFLRYGTIDDSIDTEEREKKLEEWIGIQKNNYTKIQENKEEGKPTDKQTDGSAVDWEELINIKNKMAGGSMEKLLIMMYTDIPPVRADFYATEIVYFPNKPTLSGENYILIKSPDNIEYVINDFKTSRLYEVIRGKLPKNICQELILSLHIFPRKYLFVPGNNGAIAFDRKTFSAWSTKILSGAIGKHMTLTMLRHLYINEKVDFNKSIKTLNKVSRAMGHSIGMQKQYHWIKNDE